MDRPEQFDVRTCRAAAKAGGLAHWVDRYLRAGAWANAGLREGLRRQQRFWLGPLLLPLHRLERCCGPEPEMEFVMPPDSWQRRISDIRRRLADPLDVPPLIVEWRAGVLSIRDGNHRHGAMAAAGWDACWVIVWCNSPRDHDDARALLDPHAP